MPFAESVKPTALRAFSLVELLVVLVIIAILSALIIPSIGPLMISYNLNRAGVMVTDELTFARQTALTKNADVEVRFYQMASSANATDLQYRAFRTFLANASTPSQAVALDKISYLPGQIIISTKADSSATSPSTTFSPVLESAHYTILSTGTDTLPGGTNAAYVSFLFRATGGTNLVPVTGLWYVTLYSENSSVVASTGIPSNYITAQIDPVDGQVRTYRP
jgi:uncharacterized protein (TIGR02596 family)